MEKLFGTNIFTTWATVLWNGVILSTLSSGIYTTGIMDYINNLKQTKIPSAVYLTVYFIFIYKCLIPTKQNNNNNTHSHLGKGALRAIPDSTLPEE